MRALAAQVRWTGTQVGRQVGYQLLLLTRNPMGTFTVLVVPLMLLGALTVVNPDDGLAGAGYQHYADFITPAMATFALLNACYINVATSVVTAREAGVLRRLHTSPLPLGSYVLGRLSAALVVGAVAFWVVVGSGVLALGVRLGAARLGLLAVVMALGGLCFALLGTALSTVVRSTDAALPVAYGTFLPLAFVSDVFFPTREAPAVLRDLAAAFPVSPVTRAVERLFVQPGWPWSTGQLLVLLGWTLAGGVATAGLFSWEPGGRRGRRGRAS